MRALNVLSEFDQFDVRPQIPFFPHVSKRLNDDEYRKRMFGWGVLPCERHAWLAVRARVHNVHRLQSRLSVECGEWRRVQRIGIQGQLLADVAVLVLRIGFGCLHEYEGSGKPMR